MKKILILLAVVGLTFTSCYQDEYEAPNGGATVAKAYFTTAQETVVAGTTAYDITVNFTTAFTNDVLLSYTVDGTPMQMTVASGSSSVVLASVDLATIGSAHTASLDNIASTNQSVAIDDVRNNFTVIVPYAGTPGILKLYLSWPNGTTYDLDFRIRRDNSSNTYSNNVDSSTGSTNPEVCNFPESAEADGTYYVKIKEYFSISDLNYNIIAVEPDGSNHFFTGNIVNGSNWYYNMEFTKTTDAGTGDITYTYIMY
jgi:hypothetical protein